MSRFLLQHLLRSSAESYPDNSAIGHLDFYLSYQELEEKSNQLANLLFEAGFVRGSGVGIYLNKSIESVIAFFGVLKAGGFYVPLDSAYSPLKRIVGIVQQSEIGFIITKTSLWKSFAEDYYANRNDVFPSISVIIVDRLIEDSSSSPNNTSSHSSSDREEIRYYHYGDFLEPVLRRSISANDQDLAYVLYTSGSTGVPKGVMISHLNALTFIDWAFDYFKPREIDVFANHAPLHFDLSVFDLFVSITSGSLVNLVPFGIASNPRALVDWISENRITFWYSVPQAWITMLNYAEVSQDKLPCLRKVLFAGDVFPKSHLRKLVRLLPSADYYNLYGPTETNVCTCYHLVENDVDTDHPLPIGKACANTEVIALDENGNPTGEGNEGELFVRGSSVTRGYYKDPVRSAEVFRVSPLSCHNGAQLYRTGDIVHRIDKTNYCFVGRKDLMVKHSGFRIEIAEVEQAIYSIPNVAEAIVVLQSDVDGGRTRLRAYFTSKDNVSISLIDIKKHLAAVLPKYMVPDTIKKVSCLPRNANGKIDRVQISKWES